MEREDYRRGGVVHQQNMLGEAGPETIVPIQYTFPNTMEMLNTIIDERIAYKIKQLMRKGNRL